MNQVLDQIMSRLIAEFKPTKAYLFGSQASQKATKESDYDLLLIVRDSSISRIERTVRASEVLKDLEASADVFVYTEREFEDWVGEFNSIPETAVNTGVELKVG